SESFRLVDTGKTLNSIRSFRMYVFSICAFSLSLLSKETSISFLLIVSLLVFLRNLNARVWSSVIVRMVIQVAPFVLVTGAYFAQRNLIGLPGPRFGPSRYDIHLGLNVAKNFCMFVFEAFVPASSVTVFTAIKSGNLPIVCVAILGWLTFSL